MPFTLPVFNITFDAWAVGHTPQADPPDFVSQVGQLYVHSRMYVDQVEGNNLLYTPTIILRMPLAGFPALQGNIVEATPGSADYYRVKWVQVIHLGFPNAYRAAVVEQCDAAGVSPRP